MELNSLVTGLDGRVGVCAQDSWGRSTFVATSDFHFRASSSSIVAIAVLDAVEQRGWHLEDPIQSQRSDVSLSPTFEKLVGEMAIRRQSSISSAGPS